MKYVVFKNAGEIDVRSIKTFGVSVKQNKNPIGYFGTGLKYAIAILMRHNAKMSIYTEKNKLVFEKKEVEIRDKGFEMITMNGEELPFTTHLGTNWELWQAFRELYCNALDEGGEVFLSDEFPEIKEGHTYILVQSREFEHTYSHRNEIVLKLPEALKLSDHRVEIYNKPSNHLYYRGIRVANLDAPAQYTYNVLDDCALTEDRTLQHVSSATGLIPQSVATMKSKHDIRKILVCEDIYQENKFLYNALSYYQGIVSEEFQEVLAQEYGHNNDKLNPSARDYHRKMMNKSASKHYAQEETTDVEGKQLKRAKMICKKVFSDFDDYEIMVVKTLGNSTMALADMDARKIVLAKSTFERGTKYLVSTMLEEYVHLKTGFYDHSRELQTYLFDHICSMTENHILKEPM